MLLRTRVAEEQRRCLLLVSVGLAVLPDCDVLPGLAFLGDPRAFHHQASHSITAVLLVGISIWGIARWMKLRGDWWGVWAGGVYLSHVVLDVFVDDPSPPYGAQVLWPVFDRYFIAPVRPFPRFDYFDPALGITQTVLSLHNLVAIFQEIVLLSPLVGLAWYVGTIYGSRECAKSTHP